MTSRSARMVAAIVALRVRHEDDVDALRRRLARAAATRRRRAAVPRASLTTEDVEQVVLQKDHLNVVGDHGTQSPGSLEVEVTRDADGGMRLWSDPEVHLACKNTSGGSIAAGTPVYATGTVGATSVIEVAPADASNAAKMPAIGVVDTTLAVNEQGRCTVVGVVRQLNTAAYAVNQTLFVAPGGGLTATRPTATTDRVQNIARVVRVQASTGEILVYGAGRTNDVPNYGQGKLLGRGASSGAGPAEELTVGSGLSLTGTTLSATGGGGGGGGNLQWAGSWGGTIPDGIFLSQYQGAWS